MLLIIDNVGIKMYKLEREIKIYVHCNVCVCWGGWYLLPNLA